MLGIGIFAPAAIAAGLAAAAATQLMAMETAREEKSKTGWSYVLDISDAVRTPGPIVPGEVPP